MIGKNTEKAIKAWLKLPIDDRWIGNRGDTVVLYQRKDDGTGHHTAIAKFTVKSIIAKRLPKRKKAKKVRK